MGIAGRRRFLLGAGALLGARIALAQSQEPHRVRTIGFLTLGTLDPKYPPGKDRGSIALRKLGWIEGENLVVERRYAEYKPERLAGLAQELIRKRVELIGTVEDAAALAAARATNTIPIVIINMSFPVERGLVDSLARPGRNVTGTTWQHGLDEIPRKRFEFLREIAPTAKRIYALVPSENRDTVDGRQFDVKLTLEDHAKRLGFELRQHTIGRIEDVDAALAAALAWRAQAIFGAGPIVEAARHRVAEFALRHRLPSAFLRPMNVEAGGLLSYGPSGAEIWALIDRSIEYIDRILRGANPAELPVAQPRTYELVINRKTANALGLTIPRSVLLRAGRVIE